MTPLEILAALLTSPPVIFLALICTAALLADRYDRRNNNR